MANVESLEGAITQWQIDARKIWTTLIGMPAPYAPAKFRWESAARKLAKQNLGATHFSAVLRSLARRAQEIGNLLANHADIAYVASHRHFTAAKRDLASISGDDARAVERWLVTLQHAAKERSVAKVLQLQVVADKRLASWKTQPPDPGSEIGVRLWRDRSREHQMPHQGRHHLNLHSSG